MSAVSDASRSRTLFALFLGSVVFAAHVSQVAPGLLLDGDGAEAAVALFSGFLNPDFSSDFLQRIGSLALESVWIGVLGTALALILGVPMALLSARLPDLADPPVSSATHRRFRDGVRAFFRLLLSFFRSIPEIVWAYLFVRIVGLGPGPAVLAIGVTFAGIMGKLYAELLEAVDPEPVVALRAAGASRFGALLRGALPQVQGEWINYGLFRLECGVRSASILGVVGAGGIGTEIDLSIRYFQYDKLATALLAVLLYVVCTEIASVWIRKLRVRTFLPALGIFAGFGAVRLDIPWSEMGSSQSLNHALEFLQSLIQPTMDGVFLKEAAWLTGQTLAMAWCATACAAVVAFVFAPWSTRMLSYRGYLEDPPVRNGLGRALWFSVFGLTRLFFQATRALPELVWALVFVVWVGPGMFAGVLAIAAHTTGILGRLFSDVYEQVEPQAPEALEASGASRLGRWRFAVLPSAAPRLAAYSLFRFEVNVRMTAMMGFVGAGGLGDALHTAISLFHMQDLAALLLVLFGTVAVVDAAGDRLRGRLLRQG